MHFLVIIFLASLVMGELTMISLSIVFFFLSLLSYYVLCQQSPIPSICNFLILIPLFLGHLMQSPSQFRSSSPPFPLHFLGICSLCQLVFFINHLLYMTSPCTPHQFLLGTFFHSNLHSHFIHFLVSALLTPTVIPTRLFFANLDLLLFLC